MITDPKSCLIRTGDVLELAGKNSDLRTDLVTRLGRVLKLPVFDNFLPGFLPPDPGSQARTGRLHSLVETIAEL